MPDEADPPRVLVRSQDGVGHLTLNRPKALNALDHGMVELIADALQRWADEPGIECVLLDGAGERGLCAGGDVRDLYERIRTGRAEEAGAFFRAEYALNAMISEYPKPIIALADGITMGGGIGLAGHAQVRIVTERSRLAMPETRIGFCPDVGGTWLLAHAPGRIGEYLGLTGQTMDAADAVYAGFADHVIPSADLADEPAGGRAGGASRFLGLPAQDGAPGASALAGAREWIDDAFAADTVADILARLRARPEADAATTADELDRLSPTALTVTLAAVRRARELRDLRAALSNEYAIVMWFASTQHDLVEGIRAQLVDKDRTPQWSPASLSDLDPQTAAAALTYRPVVPLWG